MKLVRPIRDTDLDGLVRMAQTAGAGFTSLPPMREFLQSRIALSEKSFAAEVQRPGPERYMFVLEETDSGEIGGCCAIEAACGMDEAFYNYRVGITVHASRELGVYNKVPTLYLSNDLTGSSVLCSLYLVPGFRGGGVGGLLSRSRFLFMAANRERFAGKLIAEMRGVSNESGRSPFWEGLGRLFFSLDYDRAEQIVGMGNKAFIAELMPKHPIYTNLLSREAQAVMGKVHSQTKPALHLLEQENFRYQGYIDIFDGGPAVETPLAEIRSIKRSRVVEARIAGRTGDTPHLIANIHAQDFRCARLMLSPTARAVDLPQDLADALRIQAGDSVRVVAV